MIFDDLGLKMQLQLLLEAVEGRKGLMICWDVVRGQSRCGSMGDPFRNVAAKFHVD